MNKLIGFADYAGMAASTLCLLHCLGTPLLLVMYPMLEIGRQEDSLHQILAGVVTVPVLVALIPGFIAHRKWRVLALGVFGWLGFLSAVLLVGPRYGETAELIAATAGGLTLLTAHAGNRRYCRRCVAVSLVNENFADQCNSVAYGVKNGS